MKRFVIGILAHVDAGKTTLSDTILYLSKSIRRPGRVDKKDSFLDSYALERERGITIFSKQAVFEYGDASFTLLDTPGHVDFSPEMERTLAALDAAVLVISGPEGIQAHTRTLWKLLKSYDIPVFIFINKMDRDVANRDDLKKELKEGLSGVCVDVGALFDDGSRRTEKTECMEEISLCDESALEEYFETGEIGTETLSFLVTERKLFPVIFGSALKQEGVLSLLKAMTELLPEIEYGEDFAARIYKIGRDNKDNRVTFMKITGGLLRTRDRIGYSIKEEAFNEKINEIRIYNGDGFTNVDSAEAGMVVGVTGLTSVLSGGVLGAEDELPEKQLMPVLTYRVANADMSRLRTLLPKFRELEDEEPQLHVLWNDELKELQIRIMGEIQLEILKERFRERFKEDVDFDRGSIIYRETVTGPVLGIGHYEPLRHYAEVQLVIEPGEKGSGIVFKSEVSTDELDLNWQRLIMTHVYEKEHRGCLIGAPVDDICITLVGGRAHLKHTEGGDFRQASYRAVRQGLMRAVSLGKCRLLEPYYDFVLEIPKETVGRALNDIDRKSGRIKEHFESAETGMTVLSGTAPVAELMGYTAEVTAYTKGLGSLYYSFSGFDSCHNEEEVIKNAGYDPETDKYNPSYSVFCAHGAGFPVPWDEVDDYKHIALKLTLDEHNGKLWQTENMSEKDTPAVRNEGSFGTDPVISREEIDAILGKAHYANRKEGYKNPFRKKRSYVADIAQVNTKKIKAEPDMPKYLLVDGYNIIFTWPELREMADINMDAAREQLNDILCNYRAMHDSEIIVVYDAYRVKGHQVEYTAYNNINIVFTKEAETADRFIERFAHDNVSRYRVTVATSDGLEQIIIRGQGAALLTAMDFYDEIKRTGNRISERLASPENSKKITSSLAIIGHIKDTIE